MHFGQCNASTASNFRDVSQRAAGLMLLNRKLTKTKWGRLLSRQILGLFRTAKGIIVWNYNSYNYYHFLLKIRRLQLSTYFIVHHKQIALYVALSNCTKTGQICVLQQLSRVKISWHIIYTFIPKARGMVVPFLNRCGILWNFCLFMVLWLPSFRKAGIKKVKIDVSPSNYERENLDMTLRLEMVTCHSNRGKPAMLPLCQIQTTMAVLKCALIYLHFNLFHL